MADESQSQAAPAAQPQSGASGGSPASSSSGQSSTPSGGGAPSNQPLDAALAAKLQGGSRGQALALSDVAAGNKGQGDKPPVEPVKVEPAKQGDAKAKAPEQGEPVAAKWEEEQGKWISSKGLDATHFDPSNEAHRKLVESARNAEAAMTKAQQEAKHRETLEKAKLAAPAKPEAKELTPIEKHEQVYQDAIAATLAVHGFQSPQQLKQERPDVWQNLQEMKNEEWRQAVLDNIEYEKKTIAEKQSKDDAQRQFAEDMRKLNESSGMNLQKFKAANPKFDDAWKASGVDAVFKFLDEQHVLPKEFILHNPEVAKWFADAVEAMEYRKSEPDREKDWRTRYEKDLMKAKGAELPAISSASSSVGAEMQSRARSSKAWANNL